MGSTGLGYFKNFVVSNGHLSIRRAKPGIGRQFVIAALFVKHSPGTASHSLGQPYLCRFLAGLLGGRMVMAQAAVDQRLRVIFALAGHGLRANTGSQYRRGPVFTGTVGTAAW